MPERIWGVNKSKIGSSLVIVQWWNWSSLPASICGYHVACYMDSSYGQQWTVSYLLCECEVGMVVDRYTVAVKNHSDITMGLSLVI